MPTQAYYLNRTTRSRSFPLDPSPNAVGSSIPWLVLYGRLKGLSSPGQSEQRPDFSVSMRGSAKCGGEPLQIFNL